MPCLRLSVAVNSVDQLKLGILSSKVAENPERSAQRLASFASRADDEVSYARGHLRITSDHRPCTGSGRTWAPAPGARVRRRSRPATCPGPTHPQRRSQLARGDQGSDPATQAGERPT